MKSARRLFGACFLLAPLALLIACTAQINTSSSSRLQEEDAAIQEGEGKLELATFGGGCFWCTEAVFQELKGVASVKSGYTGGEIENPTYKQICTGTTGHAEVIQIAFDPEIISFAKLVEVHMKTHDPTTLNRQGADHGTQYRSAVFYHNEDQKRVAGEIITKLNEAAVYPNPIVTEVTQIGELYPAEDYHQNYFENNPGQNYCRGVIQPKMRKFRKVFADYLK